MHDVTPTSVGVVTIAVVMILNVVFKFLEKMKEKQDGDKSRGFNQHDRAKLYELHKMHDRVDDDGVYVWHNRVSLEKSVVKLADAIEQLVRTQDVQLASFERMCDELRHSRRAPTEDVQ